MKHQHLYLLIAFLTGISISCTSLKHVPLPDLVFDDIDQQLDALNEVNAVISQKLKTLADLQKIIEISTASLLLAEAIISANPKGIAQAAGDIFKAMKTKPLP